MTYLPGTVDDPPRVAYAIGRHVGGAASRNRLRRRARAIATEAHRDRPLSPGAYLVKFDAAAVDLAFPTLRELMVEALHDAGQGLGVVR